MMIFLDKIIVIMIILFEIGKINSLADLEQRLRIEFNYRQIQVTLHTRDHFNKVTKKVTAGLVCEMESSSKLRVGLPINTVNVPIANGFRLLSKHTSVSPFIFIGIHINTLFARPFLSILLLLLLFFLIKVHFWPKQH